MNYTCEYCENIYANKCHLSRHQKTENCLKIQNIIHKKDELYKNKYNELNNIIELLKKDNINLNQKILTLEIKLKELSNKSDEYRKIVEKSATKTTIKNNYNHNNYLNYISSEPLKISDFSKQLKQIVNCDTVMYDDDDFHNHIVDNILKDKNGKDKVLCTDINRKNFTYKDEKSGELISDPELEKLRDELKKGTNIRQIRKDLLEKLVNDYEENGCLGIDPYKQFSDIIQKLNFGNPFVDHVAKKTYVKRCPSIKTKNNNTNELMDIDQIFEETDLFEEFVNK